MYMFFLLECVYFSKADPKSGRIDVFKLKICTCHIISNIPIAINESLHNSLIWLYRTKTYPVVSLATNYYISTSARPLLNGITLRVPASIFDQNFDF